jgi:L,D-peptidoglycan transpeptidase YkuD (ErfK/YbiS/YcfS/YnhG family)
MLIAEQKSSNSNSYISNMKKSCLILVHVGTNRARSFAHRGSIILAGKRMDCSLGRSGTRRVKREGDGATPLGVFPLRRVFYRPDRQAPPKTALPLEMLSPDDAWCDEPRHAAYNTLVRLPFEGSAEALWREDHLYDLLVVLGYNDDPVLPGAGSAIFIHVAAPGFSPTEGCIALERKPLALLIAKARPGDAIAISRDGR